MKINDKILKSIILLNSIIALCFIIYIYAHILSRGLLQIDLEFITQNPDGVPFGADGGVKGAIIGSFLIMILSTFMAGVLGVSCGIYNSLFAQNLFIKKFIRIIISCFSSIPSIIYGLFVYGFFIVFLSIPKSLLTASIAISLMIFSTIEIKIESIIKSLDNSYLRDALSLGISLEYAVFNLILPTIKNDIISTLLIAGSYGIGATAPLMMTGAVFIADFPKNILLPVMALPVHLHSLLTQSMQTEKSYACATLLLLIVLFAHIIAAIFSNNIGGRIIEYFKNRKS